jgi:hypothetical protein
MAQEAEVIVAKEQIVVKIGAIAGTSPVLVYS